MKETKNNQTNLDVIEKVSDGIEKVASQLEKDNAEQQAEKKKKKRKKVIVCCGIVLLLLMVGGGLFYINYNKHLQSFSGVGAINDSMNVSLGRPIDIASMLKGARPIGEIVAGDVVEDIESLKAAFETNKNALLASNDSVIAIPAIGVKFDLASSVLLSSELVKEYATYFMQTDQSATILVEGYACDLGDEQINMELSRNRANFVKQILLDCGVPETCIEVKWYGESKYNELGYQNKEDHRRVNVSIK